MGFSLADADIYKSGRQSVGDFFLQLIKSKSSNNK